MRSGGRVTFQSWLGGRGRLGFWWRVRYRLGQSGRDGYEGRRGVAVLQGDGAAAGDQLL